jgi:hypothetical protein
MRFLDKNWENESRETIWAKQKEEEIESKELPAQLRKALIEPMMRLGYAKKHGTTGPTPILTILYFRRRPSEGMNYRFLIQPFF